MIRRLNTHYTRKYAESLRKKGLISFAGVDIFISLPRFARLKDDDDVKAEAADDVIEDKNVMTQEEIDAVRSYLARLKELHPSPQLTLSIKKQEQEINREEKRLKTNGILFGSHLFLDTMEEMTEDGNKELTQYVKDRREELDQEETEIVSIEYTNYRGQKADRRIRPLRLWFGSSQWHPEQQWFLEAHDYSRNESRSFAVRDISKWEVKS